MLKFAMKVAQNIDQRETAAWPIMCGSVMASIKSDIMKQDLPDI
jgi:hypothetical protein